MRLLPLALVALLAGGTCVPAAEGPAREQVEFFEAKVRPVLVEHCSRCHGNGKKKGGLSLQGRQALLTGGDNGPAIVAGEPDKSRLIEAIRYKNVDLQMPPRARLPEAAVRDLTEWVRQGAVWPEEAIKTSTDKGAFDLTRRKASHWSWRPIQSPAPPEVRDSSWPQDAVDRFVLARLEDKGLRPAADADRRTWLRRVTFDLTGLPPRPDEIEAFLADNTEGAHARVVDRLLASQHFAERWARHWLDLVRYAESRGHEFDYTLPNAWQYRDYVLRAFDADVPYDQFVREHIAGDLFEQPRRHPRAGFNESVLATGFWFLGEEVHSPVDLALDEADRFDNRIDVMSKAFLGLTVACARCHDHKFDAISTKDYYALYGILQSASYHLVRFDTCEAEKRLASDLAGLRGRCRAKVGQALANAARPVAGRLTDYLLAALPATTDRPKLDAALVRRWAQHLQQAASDPTDPFHAFARAAAEPKGRWADTTRLLAEAWRRPATTGAGEVVVDYARCSPGQFLSDGGLFGTAPVRPGDVHLGGTPERPTLRIAERGCAQADTAWPQLRLTPGTENDVGALGGMVRAGRTLRTPSFLVGPGRVWYLVKGMGRAYASVQSHVVIAGPLHGSLVLGVHAPSWQWVGHDLSRYKGYRAHVEFTPQEGMELSIARIVQADAPPPIVETPPAELVDLVAQGTTPEKLAAGYQRWMSESLDRLAADHAGEADARLTDWMVRHPDLLGPEGAVARRLAEVAGPMVAEQARLVGALPTESRLALAMREGTGMDCRVFIRGSPKAQGALVPRHFLEALAGPAPLSMTRSGRFELARQMTDPAITPFVPRVLVNRVWHHLFGRGIVASVDNFGVLGEAPTHPELLDHLAMRFVKEGWSIKRLVRDLVLSRTYRMSSRPDTQADAADPQNLLWHRAVPRRLEGEALRDAILAVSGRLEDRPFGPSVPVFLNSFQEGRGRPPSGPLDGAGRRSIYLSVRRNFLSAFLLAFDTPIPFSTVGRRSVSNVPAQALILLNDPFVHQQAAVWAKRELAQLGTPQERVQRMYLRALGRSASDDECRRCLDFVGPQGGESAWAELAHAIFNTKEFLFVY